MLNFARKSSFALGFAVLFLAPSGAFADDWTGQAGSGPLTFSGPIGPLTSGSLISSSPIVVRCFPANTPPPCTPGQTPGYQLGTTNSLLTSLPQAAASTATVNISSTYYDPSSPTGISTLNGAIPLSAFARSTTVDALAANVGALSGQLQSLSISFNEFSQAQAVEDRTLRGGVALALAMGGVGDLGPSEKVAISMNVGTYGGRNSIAAGVAVRADENITFNAGFGGGLDGGLVGGRAGVRYAW